MKEKKSHERQIEIPEIEEINKMAEETKNGEVKKKKFKLTIKELKIIVLILFIMFAILAVIGKIETDKRVHAKEIYSALDSFISGKYNQANIDIKDTKMKGNDEEAFKKIIALGKEIPAKSEFFLDEKIIKEYIEVIEKMKNVVKDNGGAIKIEIYKNKKYREIQITEVAFDDAIRFANESIEKIKNDKQTPFSNKKGSILVSEVDSKTIGFFIQKDNIDGVGSSYYDK